MRQRPSTACRHTVSGTISLPSQGFFSPFPHGTGSLSVISECLALGDGPPGFPQGFSCPVVLRCKIKSLNVASTGLSPSSVGYSKNLSIRIQIFYSLFGIRTERILSFNTTSTTPVRLHRNGLGMFPFRSPLLGESLTCFLFLGVLRWFTSPGSLPHTYEFSMG